MPYQPGGQTGAIQRETGCSDIRAAICAYSRESASRVPYESSGSTTATTASAASQAAAGTR